MQNRAFNALVFLCWEVLKRDFERLEGITRVKKPQRLPVVLTLNEGKKILEAMGEIHRLVAELIYRTGIRLMKSIGLCVKDIDFEMSQIVVRTEKG